MYHNSTTVDSTVRAKNLKVRQIPPALVNDFTIANRQPFAAFCRQREFDLPSFCSSPRRTSSSWPTPSASTRTSPASWPPWRASWSAATRGARSVSRGRFSVLEQRLCTVGSAPLCPEQRIMTWTQASELGFIRLFNLFCRNLVLPDKCMVR